MDGYFEFTLKQIAYALVKIINAVDEKNFDAVKSIANQELQAINNDLENIKGDKK